VGGGHGWTPIQGSSLYETGELQNQLPHNIIGSISGLPDFFAGQSDAHVLDRRYRNAAIRLLSEAKRTFPAGAQSVLVHPAQASLWLWISAASGIGSALILRSTQLQRASRTSKNSLA